MPNTIQIPQPCKENYYAMPKDGDGRYCSVCKHNVIDFSVMHDDELLAFIRQFPFTKCGNFRIDQLNRPIGNSANTEQKSRLRFPRIAAFFALLMSTKPALTQSSSQLVVQSDAKSNNSYNRAIISGQVVNENNLPLKDVKIYLNELLITTSDTSGYYSFAVPNDAPLQNRIKLQFSSNEFYTVSYHKAMGSQTINHSFDTFEKVFIDNRLIPGAPSRPLYHFAYSSMRFPAKTAVLSNATKEDLTHLSLSINQNPQMKVYIRLGDTYNKKLNAKRIKVVHEFLIQQGIDSNRLEFSIEKRETDIDFIDIY